MIGSFWNLCRACPSMPVDKQLHSEYRSTYRWHEYTGNSRPEVVRRPPVPNNFGPVNEPPLPRRKKCPELAYKSHEFIIGTSDQVHDTRNEVAVNRARSEERGTPSRRSKSEGPPVVANGRAYPVAFENEADGKKKGISSQAGESSGLFKKTISKLSTEYRLQFVWPHVRKAITGGQPNDAKEIPRKSLSMGTIKSTQSNAMPTVHKKRTTIEREATVYELEPLVNEAEEKKHEKHYKSPESSKMNGVDTNMHNGEVIIEDVTDNKAAINGWGPYGEQWYKEVIELRKKADEYKCRGWGIEIDPGLYKKQKELWDQVSKRSSLSALSLASSIHRPITKEEKDQENNKKSIPNKTSYRTRVPGQDYSFDNKTSDEPLLPARVQTIRHHLERTTGPDVEEGALLPSPTREKLMPAIPKSKDTDSYSSQKGSPKKSTTSKHGSPQKGSPQKGSPKKMAKGRSQSVGPGVTDANESPKRQLRSISTAPTAVLASKQTKKSSASTPTAMERKPRPSTLSTTTHSRSKSSSLPHSGRTHSAPGYHHIQLSQNDTNKTSSTAISNLSQPHLRKTNKASKQARPKSTILNRVTDGDHNNILMTESMIVTDDRTITKIQDHIKLAENNEECQEKDGQLSVSSSPQPTQELPEHIIKSPPEPTRVKSPEQIIMRSPDPVNWTVPLDTGKTFTVTQNVKDGESFTRPQSEVKASTPIEKPPPAPQSAPPELAEQEKMKAWHKEDSNEPDIPMPESPNSSFTKNILSPTNRFDKPIPGSTIRCLDDPNFDKDSSTITTTSATPRNAASEVLEMARDRFDRFWGGNKEQNA